MGDTDCSGTLDFFKEFLPIMRTKLVDLDDEADLCLAFEAFDSDGSGTIGATEFRHVLKVLGQKSTDEEVDRMLDLVGTNDDGRIDYRAFVHTILHDFNLTQIRSELS